MKGAYFVFTVCVFALLAFVGSLMSIDYLHTRLSLHHAYHKALQRSMVVKEFDREFKEVFEYLVPKDLTYKLTLKKYHQYPRLLSYQVVAKSPKGYKIVYEEVMIEERK